jgi:hypothetical protein
MSRSGRPAAPRLILIARAATLCSCSRQLLPRIRSGRCGASAIEKRRHGRSIAERCWRVFARAMHPKIPYNEMGPPSGLRGGWGNFFRYGWESPMLWLSAIFLTGDAPDRQLHLLRK